MRNTICLTCLCAHRFIFVCICMQMSMCMCECVCVYACARMCAFAWIWFNSWVAGFLIFLFILQVNVVIVVVVIVVTFINPAYVAFTYLQFIKIYLRNSPGGHYAIWHVVACCFCCCCYYYYYYWAVAVQFSSVSIRCVRLIYIIFITFSGISEIRANKQKNQPKKEERKATDSIISMSHACNERTTAIQLKDIKQQEQHLLSCFWNTKNFNMHRYSA